jgi:putative membrane protein
MRTWILNVLITAGILLLFAYLFDAVAIDGFGAALLASIILSVVNTIVRPVLVLLTLPLTIVSLGLFIFVLNGLMLFVTDVIMGSAFNIEGFGMTLLLSLLLAIFHLFIRNTVAKPLYKKERK